MRRAHYPGIGGASQWSGDRQRNWWGWRVVIADLIRPQPMLPVKCTQGDFRPTGVRQAPDRRTVA